MAAGLKLPGVKNPKGRDRTAQGGGSRDSGIRNPGYRAALLGALKVRNRTCRIVITASPLQGSDMCPAQPRVPAASGLHPGLCCSALSALRKACSSTIKSNVTIHWYRRTAPSGGYPSQLQHGEFFRCNGNPRCAHVCACNRRPYKALRGSCLLRNLLSEQDLTP